MRVLAARKLMNRQVDYSKAMKQIESLLTSSDEFNSMLLLYHKLNLQHKQHDLTLNKLRDESILIKEPREEAEYDEDYPQELSKRPESSIWSITVGEEYAPIPGVC